MRRIATGVGVALAVSFPPVVLSSILIAVNDGREKLGPVLRVVLVLIVLAGPVAGGATVGRDGRRVLSVTVGAVALLAILVLGLIRQAVADNDPDARLVLPVLLVGGTLGWVGGTVRRAWPGRTRS